MCTPEQIKQYDWRSLPKLHQMMPGPSSGGRPWYTAACPIGGGRDRLQVFPEGNQTHNPQIWCRHCGMKLWLDNGNGTRKGPSILPPQPLKTDFGLLYHRQLDEMHRAYFRSRGISDAWINTARLGWTGDLRKNKEGAIAKPRWSIPCYDTAGQLWAVQYRHRDPHYKGKYKYISESGGSNNRLYTPALYVLKELPYVVITESPLDALTLCSRGIPAFAPFSGNNTFVAWRKEWNSWLPKTIIISVQQDGGKGIDIATERQKQIGRGTLLIARGGKDESDMFSKGVDLAKWVGMPIMRTLIDATSIHDSHEHGRAGTGDPVSAG